MILVLGIGELDDLSPCTSQKSNYGAPKPSSTTGWGRSGAPSWAVCEIGSTSDPRTFFHRTTKNHQEPPRTTKHIYWNMISEWVTRMLPSLSTTGKKLTGISGKWIINDNYLNKILTASSVAGCPVPIAIRGHPWPSVAIRGHRHPPVSLRPLTRRKLLHVLEDHDPQLGVVWIRSDVDPMWILCASEAFRWIVFSP